MDKLSRKRIDRPLVVCPQGEEWCTNPALDFQNAFGSVATERSHAIPGRSALSGARQPVRVSLCDLDGPSMVFVVSVLNAPAAGDGEQTQFSVAHPGAEKVQHLERVVRVQPLGFIHRVYS